MKSKKYPKKTNLVGKILGIHIVFHTKYNRSLLNEKIQLRAKEIIHDILEECGCMVVEIRVYPNRVHTLFVFPPTQVIPKTISKVKGKSSYLLRKEYPELKKQCPKALWAPKYSLYSWRGF